MSSLGRWCYRNRRVVILLWALLLVGLFALGRQFPGESISNPESPASESNSGFEVIETYFGGVGSGISGTIVFETEAGIETPAVREAMQDLFADVAELDGVAAIGSPYDAPAQVASSDGFAGNVAYATLDLEADVQESRAGEIGKDILSLRPDIDGLRVEIGGAAFAEFEPPESELIGIAFAVVVLILAFGSVLAMGLPIGTAIAGVSGGVALIGLLSTISAMPEFANVIGAMIGLGVGIDYALFIVTRVREGMHDGLSTEEAVVEAMDTAGRAVLFAGITVVISLLGMLIMGLAFISGMGIGAAATVAMTMGASLTLLPALLGFVGDRLEVTRVRGLVAAGLVAVALLGVGLSIQPLLLGAPLAVVVLALGFVWAPLKKEIPRRATPERSETGWYRWSRFVQKRPWPAAIIGTVILLVLAIPVLSLRLGFSDEGNFSTDTTTRQAYDLLADGFGPGFNGPLILAAELDSPADLPALAALTEAVNATEGVEVAFGPIPNNPGAPEAALIRVVPTTAPQDEATSDLVENLRANVIPGAVGGTNLDVHVTGLVASGIDFTDYLSGRLTLFFAAVLLLSFLLLMMVFRSVLVPLKAVIMNLLSIAAAYGIVVAIFQWGWAIELFGLDRGAPIEPFIPMMMFAIVFGLSMDYEVFLLSRIKEEYDRTGDAETSVADGLAATARVISAAAAIMVVVFGSFMFEPNRITKLFGLGLSMAVLLDATLVRMLLVPATMELLGKRNWWLPGWLDRILPTINVEGPAHSASVIEEKKTRTAA